MSKVVKTVASIALPIAGAYFGGPVGAAIGGGIGGAVSGGGVKGIALGALTGYMGANALPSIVGTAAGTPIANVTGNAALQGPSLGSGVKGFMTGGGVRALGSTLTSAAANPTSGIIGIGNQLMATSQADDAKKAAKIQAAAIDRATATQAPYNELGTNAAAQIQQIQADPGAYVQNNAFYKSLADEAQRRLSASQASKGKLASGGTQAALQDELLQLGNGLVQQQIGTLQNQVNSGQNAANATSTLQTAKGDAQASGVIGAGNAMTSGYQNQINTLLALQNLNRTPTYSPTQMLRA